MCADRVCAVMRGERVRLWMGAKLCEALCERDDERGQIIGASGRMRKYRRTQRVRTGVDHYNVCMHVR